MIKSEKLKLKIPREERRSVKISTEQRDEIKNSDLSISQLAKKYWVSRRLIDFYKNPERLERQKELYRERRKDGRYYDKEKHKDATRKTREYRKNILSSLLQHETIQPNTERGTSL